MTIVEALADCLEELRRGGEVEACLERYPQYRSELRELLEVAARIQPLPEEVAPAEPFREATKARIFDEGAVRRPRRRRARSSEA